jgi:O-antigen/teichoic acid export membrane protein
MQTNTLKKSQEPGYPLSQGSQEFNLSTGNWREVALYSVFGLLFVLLIVFCSTGSSPFIVIAIMAALAVGVIAVRQPYFAIFLVFVSAGLPTLLLPIPGHTVRPIELALFLCFLAVLVHRCGMRLRLPHLLALLFLAITVISFIHVPEISTNLKAYAADKRLYGWVLIFLAFFCGTFLTKYVKDPSSFLVAILLSNLPLYFISLAQAMHIHLPTLLEVSDAENPKLSEGRLWGPTDGAATFGLYLINLFAIALACWLLGKRRRDRIIGALMTVATVLTIIGSGTRSAAIAAALITLTSFLLTRRFKLLFILLGLAGVGFIIFANKIVPLFTHPDSSDNNRVFLAQYALELIATNPWLGIGLQQFHYYYAQVITSLSAQLDPHGVSVHDQYLEWALESGILWSVVGVSLLFSILSACWKSLRLAEPGLKALLLATGMAVLGTLVASFFDVPLDKPEAGVLLFLMAGVAMGYVEQVYWKRKVLPVPVVGLPFLESPSKNPLEASRSSSQPTAASKGPPPISEPLLPIVSPDNDQAPNTQKTGRTVLIQLLSWGIAIPIIFPTTALLTRYLGPLQYGEYSFALPYLSIFSLLSGIGMDALIIRQLSRQPRGKWSNILSYAVGTRLVFTLLGAIAAALVALLLPISSEQRNLLLLGSVSLIFSFSVNGLRIIYSHGFRAEQRVSGLALIETTNRVVTAGLVVVIVVLHLSLWWAYFLIIYSDVPFFILQIFIARRRYKVRIRFSLARMREHLLGGFPLLGYNVMVLIAAQADIIFLMVLVGPIYVGIFSLASRITDPLISIAVAYITGVYPLLCRKFEEGREHFAPVYHEATRILALVIIPLAIFVSTQAKQLVILLGGEKFTTAAIAVQLLMWAMAATFFNQLAVSACTAANKERVIPYVTVISVSVNVLTNLILIPHWKIVGAGVASVASEFVSLCLFSVLLRRQVHLWSVLWVILRVFLGNLPALAFLLWQEQSQLLSPLLTAPILLILIIAGCVATRTLSLKDIRAVQHIFSKKSASKPFRDITDWPTAPLSALNDITEYPTLALPRIKV